MATLNELSPLEFGSGSGPRFKRLSKATPEEELNEEEMTKVVAREGLRKYWKIIGVTYQSFKDMLKGFDREDLVTLWSLVKERFRSAEPTEDMEKALWVELKR
ncbi:hypothetical protein Tco_1303946 [Tanacetum coccineum]